MVTIYVLKLENNKYYVGKTTNPRIRLETHFSDLGSYWTKKYKPISIHELRPDKKDIDEQIVTQEYMKKYGIDNVRGGPWCKITLTEPEKDMIIQIIKASDDNCYKCGKKGHFYSNCKKITTNCSRCRRENHNSSNCYAKIDVDGNILNDEEEVIWLCSYCNKEFDTEKGANYHERVYCKKKKTNNCKRCGRLGHNKSNCYVSTHKKGYTLYY